MYLELPNISIYVGFLEQFIGVKWYRTGTFGQWFNIEMGVGLIGLALTLEDIKRITNAHDTRQANTLGDIIRERARTARQQLNSKRPSNRDDQTLSQYQQNDGVSCFYSAGVSVPSIPREALGSSSGNKHSADARLPYDHDLSHLGRDGKGWASKKRAQ